jgi:hypothetical protein
LQKGIGSLRNVQLLLGAFGFRSLAAGVTIYSVEAHTATEAAPAASLLVSNFGVVTASILVNVIWVVSMLSAFFLIEKMIRDEKIKQAVLHLSVVLVLVPPAFDGLWDLGVLVRFSEFYVVSIATVSVLICLTYFNRRRGIRGRQKQEIELLIERS